MDERIFCAYVADVFRAAISIGADGESVVGWEPDLNDGGTKHERVYTVDGQGKPHGQLGSDQFGEQVLPRQGEHAVRVDGDKRICSPLTRLTVSRTPSGVSKSVC